MSSGIDVRDLTVMFGQVAAVSGATFTCGLGDITALLGPNGAGKTTTVDVVSGLRRPTSGQVRVLDRHPDDPELKPRIGVMPQIGGLYPSARPLAWLRYLSRLYPNPSDPEALLTSVGIDPAMRTPARRMSGGEQQRVKLAAALLPRPALLILDEPTAGLDPLARRNVLDVIGGYRASGATILLTTHQLADVEELADHVIVMKSGSVLVEGTVAELTGAQDALVFDSTPHLDIDSLCGALPSGYRIDEPAPGHYVVHGAPTPGAIASITAWCASRDVLASNMRAGRRTLEEILIDAAEDQP